MALAIQLSADGFYDIGTVHTIQLVFTQSNWDTLLDQLYAAGEDRLLGTAIIDGVTYDSVGVRYKGNSSYDANRVKNPFNIKLDYVHGNQNIEGYTTIKLANGFSDPSFIRETLGYEIARKYMPASKANYAVVYVNGTQIGLYTNVEDVGDKFQEEHFYAADKTRIKGINDAVSLWTIWGYINATESSYANYYEVDSGSDMSTFISFLNTLNNNNSAVETVFNVDRHLWMIAFDNLFVSLDAPINFGHNFYVCEDSANRYNSVPWDLNMSFGGFTRLMTGTNLTTTTMQQLNPLLNSTHSSYPILNKILSNSMYKRMYLAHMRTMIEDNVSNGLIGTRGLQIQNGIASYVQSDPNKFYTYANFTANLNSSVTGGGSGGPGGPTSTVGLTQLMTTRGTWLLTNSAFSGTRPVISAMAYSPTVVQPNSNVTFTLTATGSTTAYLGYRQSKLSKFTRVQMFDDGLHGDGAANNGVYGVTVSVGYGNIEYYGYAENSSQGRFSPDRAEYEFYQIELPASTGDILINEIMTNPSSYTDSFGEADDWVELYNPNDYAVDVAGMYLVDNHYAEGVTAWTQIPINYTTLTTIQPHDYLVLWFDEQTTQGPLHINNKLSGSGDAVYLISSNGSTVIDSYTWDQTAGLDNADVSIGRYPDGSENWTLFSPVSPIWPSPGFSNTAAETQNIITAWSFENTSTSASAGNGTLSLLGGITNDSFNSGYGSTYAMSTTSYPAQGTGTRTAGIRVDVSTAGFRDISLSWSHRFSNTSANKAVLYYTLDGSASSPVWVEAGTYSTVSGDTWMNFSFDASAISGANNNPHLAFKIVSAYNDTAQTAYMPSNPTSTYAASGKWRWDNIIIGGDQANAYMEILAAPEVFEAYVGEVSEPQIISINGTDLQSDVLVTAPAHFRVRESAASAYTTQLSLSPVGGSLTTTIQVAFAPSAGGVCNEDLLFSGGGCGNQNLNLTGSGLLFAPMGVLVTRISDTTIQLSWESVAGAAYYSVYRSVTPYALFPDEWELLSGNVSSNAITVSTASAAKCFYRISAHSAE
jgi:hypothetical protein